MELIQSLELPAPAGHNSLAWRIGRRLMRHVFGARKPARAVVPVPDLHYGFMVEVQLVAQRATA